NKYFLNNKHLIYNGSRAKPSPLLGTSTEIVKKIKICSLEMRRYFVKKSTKTYIIRILEFLKTAKLIILEEDLHGKKNEKFRWKIFIKKNF
ncbi:MAG TPA: hypothetical protein PLK41_01045, partial [Defluviitoga tunisiensis]|nr:hypothetical protein [Defluviitoga tunisiensis]HQD43144.1 hypothetical protein [Defluviitoga tunisiensis]